MPKEQTIEKKRYHLVIPEDVFAEVRNAAKEHGTTVVHLLRWFIKIGLVALKASKKDGCALVIREGKTERQIFFS